MWWESPHTLVARGLIALAAGTILMLWPGMSLAAFVFVFGAFAIVDGGLLLFTSALTRRHEPGRAITAFVGIAAILLGVVTFAWPGLTALALLILVALRALIVGAVEVAACVHLWRQGAPRSLWLIGCAGTLSIAFGVLLLAFPGTGLVALMWTIGIYTIAVGLLTIASAWAHSAVAVLR